MTIGLIEAVVLLDQGKVPGKKLAMAQKLAGQVLGRILPRLPLETKVLFLLLKEMARKEGNRFDREKIRKYTSWNRQEVKVHVDRLVRRKFLEREKNVLVIAKRKLELGDRVSFPNRRLG